MSNTYQYKPLEDSLLGKAIADVWLSYSFKLEELENAIQSNLNPKYSFFTGTKKSEKQILMGILPDKIRKWISNGNTNDIQDQLKQLISGTESSPPKIDIALELMEWILTGFDKDDIFVVLLNELANQKIHFPDDFLSKLKDRYNVLLQSDSIDIMQK